MKDSKLYNLISTLLLAKLMELLKKPKEEGEEEEKPTPREQLAEMYANPKDDVKPVKEPNINKIMAEYRKQPINEDLILQKLEALIKEKEIISEQKQDIIKDRTYLEDQQKSQQRAMLEIK